MKEIVDYLNKGELVITPTDTIYGIMADATNDEAVKKVYEAKHRSFNKPLLLLVDSMEMVSDYTLEIDDLSRKLMEKYWPGPLTILFKKNDKIAEHVSKNEYVGIRYPNNELLLNIIKEFGKPVVSTSANISDEDVVPTIDKIPSELLERIDYVLDGGELATISSTLVKIDNKIIILRDGLLSDKIKEDFYDYI